MIWKFGKRHFLQKEKNNVIIDNSSKESQAASSPPNAVDLSLGEPVLGDLVETIPIETIEADQKDIDEASLKSWVEMSVTTNRSVGQIARMSRSVREVDTRTQSIASATEEITASIESVSDTSNSVAADAREAALAAKAGIEVSRQTVHTMGTISEAVNNAVDRVQLLSDSSAEIGIIVETIEAIARQINMLAINATIEAARAGDAGKGFAVVAGEVKSLATQTGKATEDIRERIETLQSEMGAIVEVMNSGRDKVEEGRTTIQNGEEEMGKLSSVVSAVDASMASISESLTEQRSGMQAISGAVEVISTMSAANVHFIDRAIGTLEATEGPIVESINNLAAAGATNGTVHAAKSDHMIWMRKLAQMLAGRADLKPGELADHHSCRLGKWYDNQTDPILIGHPAWGALLEPHAAVHHAGIEAARAYELGDHDRAIQFVNEAGKASVQVMKLLNELSENSEAN